ncbi:spermidine synthase [Thalassotalea aquiviva]|uniref:spermidine synthase n=1 Tax=Thalassotalea aquiviva TaxID=3242415 RepID=UPI003529FF8A
MFKLPINAVCLLFLFIIGYSAISQAEVIKEERSLYRNILIEDTGNKRCLKFSVKRQTSSQSCVYKDDPDALVFNYTKFAMSSLVFNPEPKSVLIIGLGGGTLSNTLLRLYPDITIDNVEIDPAIIRVAKEYFDFKQSKKVKAIAQDGRIFIKRAMRQNKQYDLIILDAFNGEYIPEHLLTKEFLQETDSLLSAQGVLVANTFSTSELFHHETATYHHVFGDFYSLINPKVFGNRIIMVVKDQQAKQNWQQQVPMLSPLLQKFDVDLKEVLSFMSIQHKPSSDYKVLTDQYSPANLL